MDIGNSKKQERKKRDAGRERHLFSYFVPLTASRGFTLLEVMIALAVVAIALVTLLGTGSRSIDVHGRLQKITQATLLAQQRMSEIEIQAAGGSGLPLLEEEGVFEAPFEQFRWRVLYEDSPLPQLKIVTVTVAWGEERRNEMVDLNSFIIQ